MPDRRLGWGWGVTGVCTVFALSDQCSSHRAEGESVSSLINTRDEPAVGTKGPDGITRTIQQGSLCTYSLCRKPKLIFHGAGLQGQHATPHSRISVLNSPTPHGKRILPLMTLTMCV